MLAGSTELVAPELTGQSPGQTNSPAAPVSVVTVAAVIVMIMAGARAVIMEISMLAPQGSMICSMVTPAVESVLMRFSMILSEVPVKSAVFPMILPMVPVGSVIIIVGERGAGRGCR